MKTYLWVVLILWIYYWIIFIIGQIKKNNSVVDIFWGLGFVIVAWSSLLFSDDINSTKLIVTLLVTVWGLRLTYHIGKRNIGKSEDFRYVDMRKKWGTSWVLLKSYLHVYLLQMILLLAIASSYTMTNLKRTEGVDVFTIIGICIWLIGFYFESVSDAQLAAFKKNPNNKGKIMVEGLFKYSRHPNYFGEATMWWGIFIIGIMTPGGLWTIISPITITYLVRFVSGVPMLEKHYENNEKYQNYAKKTNIFIPWLPKK